MTREGNSPAEDNQLVALHRLAAQDPATVTTTFRRIPEKSPAVRSRHWAESLCTTQIDITGGTPRVTLSALEGKQSGRTNATKGRIGFDTIK